MHITIRQSKQIKIKLVFNYIFFHTQLKIFCEKSALKTPDM